MGKYVSYYSNGGTPHRTKQEAEQQIIAIKTHTSDLETQRIMEGQGDNHYSGLMQIDSMKERLMVNHQSFFMFSISLHLC